MELVECQNQNQSKLNIKELKSADKTQPSSLCFYSNSKPGLLRRYTSRNDGSIKLFNKIKQTNKFPSLRAEGEAIQKSF